MEVIIMEEYLDFFKAPENLIKRKYNDKSSLIDFRTEFMRDRDRVMYATAFRRLAGKTQIYTVGMDDHKKNRLTHTLEVGQIARTIAKALGLDVDLAEAIALAHDFGHTPFGHAGEQILHEIMIPKSQLVEGSPFYDKCRCSINDEIEKNHPDKKECVESLFGFKHNIQSVRVATLLEDSYRGDNNENIGLNLTNFTLFGMMLHSNTQYNEKDEYPNYQNYFNEQFKFKESDCFAWSFEAYVVKWADDIAQWHHDLEDAMRGGALPLDNICGSIKELLQDSLLKEDQAKLEEICRKSMDRKNIAILSHIVVNTLVENIVKTSKENFKTLYGEIGEEIKLNPEKFFKEYDSLSLSISKENVINVSKEINKDSLKETIKKCIHHSRNVERMNVKGKYIIRKLFEAYFVHPQQLPDGPILHFLVESNVYKNIDVAKEAGIGEARVKFEDIMKKPDVYSQVLLMRRICDHIASMTDHYAIEEYNNLYG